VVAEHLAGLAGSVAFDLPPDRPSPHRRPGDGGRLG
jgi:hypothetical protein